MAVFVAMLLTTMSFLTTSYWLEMAAGRLGLHVAVSCTKALLVVLFLCMFYGKQLEVRAHNSCSYDGYLPCYYVDTRHWPTSRMVLRNVLSTWPAVPTFLY